MEQTLEQQANSRDNDYSKLEIIYRTATNGGELVFDPYDSVRHAGPSLTLTASVIIPAWNARDTIEKCLISIEQSSFNFKYPQQLEVIVVDDGSIDGTWQILEQLQLNLRLKAVHQKHHSRAHTQNTAIALAEGDIIISLDSDMILSPFSIEELVKRHQILDKVMLIGFRSDINPDDPRIQPETLRTYLPEMLPPFQQDVRIQYHGGGGWPESMCRDSQHLKNLGGGKKIFLADGSKWDLPGIVYGALFSLRRSDFYAMDGYDERFFGWGCEDTLVGVRSMALGNYIIPVYAAAGWHIAHGDRSPRKWQEFSANRQVFQQILHSPFLPETTNNWLRNAQYRVLKQFERLPDLAPIEICNCYFKAYEAELSNPDKLGKYLHSMGRYGEAAAAFATIYGTPDQEAWALFDQAKSLRADGEFEQATTLLVEAATHLPNNPWPLIELALSLAATNDFAQAREYLEIVRELEPYNPLLNFLLNRPVAKHLERAEFYSQQGELQLAIRDYEAALILDPYNTNAQVERAALLSAQGKSGLAQAALSEFVNKLSSDVTNSKAKFELSRLYLAQGQTGAAKVVLEQLRRLRPRDPEMLTQQKEVQKVALKQQPIPIPRIIIEKSKGIPGWLGEDEAELLIAVTLRAGAVCEQEFPPVLIEIGCYCGRATIAMGLALKGLGRSDARIITVEDPSVGLAPGNRAPREILLTQRRLHNLDNIIICAPEEQATPWDLRSRLLLVDGQHDYASIQQDTDRYTPNLAVGGLLLFHDYADYFPDVQRFVEETMLNPQYEFVAQASSLIALIKVK